MTQCFDPWLGGYQVSCTKSCSETPIAFIMEQVRRVLWAFVFLLQATVGFAQAPPLHGRVVLVADGDTVSVFTEEKERLRIRLGWIDAPELDQPFGYRAKQALSGLVFAKNVELRPFAKDRHGHLVCLVLVKGKDAGLEMLKEGFAWADSRDFPEAPPEIQTSYHKAADKAHASHQGLWIDANPEPPWEYRRIKQAKPGKQ